MTNSNQEKLLLLLNELQERLSSPDASSESNPAQMFSYFLENSSAGSECAYARKALLLFMKRDYQDVKKLVYDIVRTIEVLEGEVTVAHARPNKEDY